MKDFKGKVAVVTGGASGIGRATGQLLAEQGMKVVLADIERPALEATVAELRGQSLEVTGIPTDLTRWESVKAMADEAVRTYGKINVAFLNAGVASGGRGNMWDVDLNDWAWGMAVNVWGVIHGIKAFVPGMVAGGDEGHVVNTSSGNGGIAPLASTAVYALTKSGVVTITESLYAQLQTSGAGDRIGASVLFPGPKMLRTGLFESWRNRRPELANPTPRRTPPTTIESFEKRMADAGVALDYTPVEEVAGRVVEAVRGGAFWILPPSERTDTTINARAASMLARSNPTYLTDVTG